MINNIKNRISIFALLGLVLIIGSCSKYLNVNDNPNEATTSTPEVMLPQALTATAGVANTFNTMGARLGGYMANAGGYGGFGSAVTYSFGTSDYQTCWSGAYDNLTDYQWIINNTNGDLSYGFYNGAAKIMKAYDFELLVDAYNNVPYTKAFLEQIDLTPTYDDAKIVYDSIYVLLDSAISIINRAQADLDGNSSSNVKNPSSSDVLFGGKMEDWKKLANSLKLRIAVKGKSGGLTFNNDFDEVGFLDKDAVVNPGYQQADGKQNPFYNSWAYLYNGNTSNAAWIPSEWIASFYDGTKISDDYRGYATFTNYGSSSWALNQLGIESNDVSKAPGGGGWLPYGSLPFGVMKGPGASAPIFTQAESDFLQAEAVLVDGLGVNGEAEDHFNDGILHSYNYLFTDANGSPDWSSDDFYGVGVTHTDFYDAYLEDNAGNYLVDYESASSDAERLEAIITQKYIALNMIACNETWDDFRRTGYPKIVNGSSSPTLSFASTQSTSSRADKLPSRILYPTSEFSYNNGNVPKGINQFTDRIFWDPQ